MSAAELSRLLFDARELIDMLGAVAKVRTGQPDDWSRRVRDGIDAYRKECGWSPHGFGGERGVVTILDADDAQLVERVARMMLRALTERPNTCQHRYPDGTRCTLTDHSAPGLAAVHHNATLDPCPHGCHFGGFYCEDCAAQEHRGSGHG